MNTLIKQELLNVRFSHIISPNVYFYLEDDIIAINGKVKINIENLLGSFTSGLGLKNIFSKVIEKKVTNEGYFMNITGIATASISLTNDKKLLIKAEYRAGKEWWAKPVALTVLSSFLEDFNNKLISAGVKPGFGNDIKNALQSLRKTNKATLDLKNLFENQNFYHNKNYNLYNFSFKSIDTYSENDIFVINFTGKSNFS